MSEDGEVLLFDKPYHWTSAHVVATVKRIYGYKKVGHAGTLDPLATGLLILCTEKKTKGIDLIQAQEKEYTGIIRLGASTPSFDMETEPDFLYETSHITKTMIAEAVKTLTGKIKQVPPNHSAKKVDGKRAYKLARQGKVFELLPREVEIYDFEITEINMPDLYFRVKCSKGTYIRSLAHDIGKLLGSGGHLTKLCRTRIGAYKLEDAWTIEAFREKFGSDKEI